MVRYPNQLLPFWIIYNPYVLWTGEVARRAIWRQMEGGGGRFPYPKWVWSPSGGWWGQPKNWKSNTLVVGGVIAAIGYQAFRYSSANEVRLQPPIGWIPSMMWSAEFKNEAYQNEVKKHYDEGIYIGNKYDFQKSADHGHGHGEDKHHH